jgi:hypothetical protein
MDITKFNNETITDSDYPRPPGDIEDDGFISIYPSFIPFCNSAKPLLNERPPLDFTVKREGDKDDPASWEIV